MSQNRVDDTIMYVTLNTINNVDIRGLDDFTLSLKHPRVLRIP